MPTSHTLTVGQSSASLPDPHFWTDSRSILSIRFNIYEALVKYDRGSAVIPGLASGWRVEEDARTWTFDLRRDVRFHDGSPCTAEDAAASIRRAAGPGSGGDGTGLGAGRGGMTTI